jgi:hypothetical protein
MTPWSWNINHVAIASVVRHPLRTDSPRGDQRCPGNLALSVCGDLTRIVVTCANILTSHHSSMGYPFAFSADANALLPRNKINYHTLSFGTMLSPDYLRRKIS